MKILRNATEAEMIAEYLAAESESARFRGLLTDALTALNVDSRIITEANLENAGENILRKRVLAFYRGYGENREMFENFPDIYILTTVSK